MVDEKVMYPYRQTEYPSRDAVFNWIVRRHLAAGKKPWRKSDDVVWGGFLYHVLDYIFLLIYIWFVWWIVTLMYDHFGMFKAVVTLSIFVLIRLNSLIRQAKLTNRLLQERL